MPRIILVRHGRTVWNEEGRYQGKIDIPLSQAGKEQARKVGEALKDIPIKAIYSSPLSRCLDTAKEIAKHHGIDVKVRDGLKEIDHGKWEGMLASEVEREYPKLLRLWRLKPSEVKMPGGESLAEVYERVVKEFNSIISEHGDEDNIVIVGHDATNKVLMCHLLGLSLDNFWTFKQANCGISVVELGKDKLIIHVLNATGHLGKNIDFEVQKSL